MNIKKTLKLVRRRQEQIALNGGRYHHELLQKVEKLTDSVVSLQGNMSGLTDAYRHQRRANIRMAEWLVRRDNNEKEYRVALGGQVAELGKRLDRIEGLLARLNEGQPSTGKHSASQPRLQDVAEAEWNEEQK